MLHRPQFIPPNCGWLLLTALIGLALAVLDPALPAASAKPRARAQPQVDFFDIFAPPRQKRVRKRRARPAKAQAKPGSKEANPPADRPTADTPASKPPRRPLNPNGPASKAPDSKAPAAEQGTRSGAGQRPKAAITPPRHRPGAPKQEPVKPAPAQEAAPAPAPATSGQGRIVLPAQAPLPPLRPGSPTRPQTSSPAPAATLPSVLPVPPPAKPELSEKPLPPRVLPPSACLARLKPDRAVLRAAPQIADGGCGMSDVVQLEAVVTPEGERVALTPPAILRCDMAERVVDWVRGDVDALLHKSGTRLTGINVMGSYECRGRNRVIGGKLSQHGLGNAIDLGALVLADHKTLGLVDTAADKDMRLALKASACGHFTTVLGPGSDGFHENHIHLDFIQRRRGYRICQWDVK